MEHHAFHYRRYGFARLFIKHRLSVEVMRRRRISSKCGNSPFGSIDLFHFGFCLRFVADLCGRIKIHVNGRTVPDNRHSGFHLVAKRKQSNGKNFLASGKMVCLPDGCNVYNYNISFLQRHLICIKTDKTAINGGENPPFFFFTP